MKVLLAGVAIAVVTGTMLGGAMRPDLITDRPEGPQMYANWAGDRSTGPFDPGTTFVSYGPNVPDYVMGTDWKKRMAWPDERAAVAPSVREDVADDDTTVSQDTAIAEPVTLARAAYDDAPSSTAQDYPSAGGGVTPDAPAEAPADVG
ncbi:MAG TPA: hypothetical protein VIE16_02965 [Phenylobacterium sp.]